MQTTYELANDLDNGESKITATTTSDDGATTVRTATIDEESALRLNYALWALDMLLESKGYQGDKQVIREHGQFVLMLAFAFWED